MRRLDLGVLRLVLCTLLLALPASHLRAVPVTISVIWDAGPAEAPAPAQAAVELVPADGATDDSPRREALSVPGEVTLELPAESLWNLQVVAPGAWARDFVFAVPAKPSDHLVRLQPTGRLTGQLELPDGVAEVQELTVRFQAPPQGDPFDPARGVCPVSEDGHWQCELPRGSYDLRLGARGFAPKYFWGVEVPTRGEVELGSLQLRPGASLSGSVVLEPGPDTGRTLSSQVTVILKPVVSRPEGNYADSNRLPQLQRTVHANEWGHFQFTELISGEYFVTARAPGFADSVAGPVSVFAPNESILDESIPLRPPASFEAVIEPTLSPTGDPWRLWLRPTATPGRDQAGRYGGYAGLDGGWKVEDLPEGSYLLSVFSATTEWLTEEVEIEGGTGIHQVRVPVVTVEGRLRWRGEPRPLALWFVELGTQKRTRFELDEEDFQGYLPYGGWWQVLLFDAESRRRYFLEPVEVEVSKASGVARVEIDVPDGVIQGRVIDAQDQGVPDVEVELGVWQKPRLPSTTRTDADGRFQFELLAPRSYLVSVDVEDFAFASQRVDLQQGLEPPRVILQLEEETALTVRVAADGLPLPGAVVEVMPLNFGPRRTSHGITGVTGEVELQVPKGAPGWVALVFPPGGAVRLLPVAPEVRRVEVPVGRVGGTLTVHWNPRSDFQFGTLTVPPTLIHEGLSVSLGLFRGWARDRGVWDPALGTISIPMLEPGRYTVCAPGQGGDPQGALAGASDAETGCQSGLVVPSGELVLNLS